MLYSKTESGQLALLSRSLALTPRQRSAFIMFDGKRTTQEVLTATAGLGITKDDISHLVSLGLLAAVALAEPIPVDPAAAATAAVTASAQIVQKTPSLSAQAHYLKAYPIAARLTAGLGLRGFRLNLAVEAAGDLVKLRELAPKIMQAVGPEKFVELNSALYD
jgi:hypothetical protein